MPHKDGVELCRRIRAMSNVSIIVLSVKGEERTKVEALDSGADDYVTKPFGIDELLARVRAALRRGSSAEPEVASFDAGDFRIDLDGRRVIARGQEIRLTPKEFDLFIYMARHPNRVITHRTLLEAVSGRSIAGAARVSACVHGTAAEDAGARPVEPEVSRHRTVGRLPLQPSRVTAR